MPKESRATADLEGNSSSLRRSHSQTQLNKPSNDLLGLSLHPMDPIDPPKTDEQENNEAPNATTVAAASNVSAGITDLTSTLLKGELLDNSQDSANTSREVQDILGEFTTNTGAPALPPKQNASFNRPSSVQREKISSSLIALPRPPSRMSQSSAALSRPRGTPSPALGSSPKETTNSGTLRRFSSQVSQVSLQDSPSRKSSAG